MHLDVDLVICRWLTMGEFTVGRRPIETEYAQVTDIHSPPLAMISHVSTMPTHFLLIQFLYQYLFYLLLLSFFLKKKKNLNAYLRLFHSSMFFFPDGLK